MSSSKEEKKEYRKSPVVFAFGIRTSRSSGTMVIDFLDMDLENEIICSICINEELAISLKERLETFIEDENVGE